MCAQFEQMSYRELQQACKARGLGAKGKAGELRAKLEAAAADSEPVRRKVETAISARSPRYKRLAESFISEQSDERPLNDDGAPADNDAGSDTVQDWSQRSSTHSKNWLRPEYREAVLAKRRATLVANGRQAKPKPKKKLDAAAQKRSNSLRLLRRDEEAWMAQRLEAGTERRALIYDDELKRQRQQQRSEAARRRHAERRDEKAAALAAFVRAKNVTHTA